MSRDLIKIFSTEIVPGHSFLVGLYRDLAKKPLVKILYRDLVKRTEILLRDLLEKPSTASLPKASCTAASTENLSCGNLAQDFLRKSSQKELAKIGISSSELLHVPCNTVWGLLPGQFVFFCSFAGDLVTGIFDEKNNQTKHENCFSSGDPHRGILSDILSGVLSDIYSDRLSGIL